MKKYYRVISDYGVMLFYSYKNRAIYNSLFEYLTDKEAIIVPDGENKHLHLEFPENWWKIDLGEKANITELTPTMLKIELNAILKNRAKYVNDFLLEFNKNSNNKTR